MGMFDEVAGGLMKNVLSNESGQTNLLESLTGLISNSNTGGLNGLVQTFKDKGLGDVVSSWISTGKNLPISAEQVQQAIGSPQVQQIAQKLGVSHEAASQSIAEYLPQVIDKLTPNGSVPTEDLLSQGLTMLKGKIFGG